MIDHINNKVTPISTIVTQVYPLDELQAAMDKAIDAKEKVYKRCNNRKGQKC